eukprot:scaffold86231_cov37-Cyclotella_meneghiniana.AAC.3
MDEMIHDVIHNNKPEPHQREWDMLVAGGWGQWRVELGAMENGYSNCANLVCYDTPMNVSKASTLRVLWLNSRVQSTIFLQQTHSISINFGGCKNDNQTNLTGT